jgi:hypothetical protein
VTQALQSLPLPPPPPIVPISVLPIPELPSGTIRPSTLMVDHGIGNLSIGAGQSFTYVIPKDAFASSTDARLSFQVTQANGAPLPNWLRFDPKTGTFSGVVPPGVRGDLHIRVKAVDGKGNEAVTTFTIKSGVVTRENDKPRAAAPLSSQGLLSVLGVPGFSLAPDDGIAPDLVAGQLAEQLANTADGGDESAQSAPAGEGHAPQLSAQLQRQAQRFAQARETTLHHLASAEKSRQPA